VRTFENGFAIEELAPGQPNGKLAKPGKKVRPVAPLADTAWALGPVQVLKRREAEVPTA